MSVIKVRFGSGNVINLSNHIIYSSIDLIDFVSAEPNSEVKIETMPTYITDENKTPMAVARVEDGEDYTIYCYRYVYEGQKNMDLAMEYGGGSAELEISLPLFPESTPTKTTAHLTPQFVT